MEDAMIVTSFILVTGFCDNGNGMEMHNVPGVSYVCGQSAHTYVTGNSYRTALDPT